MAKMRRMIALVTSLCIMLGALALVGCRSQDAVGIKSAKINDKGELVITYTNGESENLGVVVGEDGEDGKDGKDGENGKDGQAGQNGQDGADGQDGQSGAGADNAFAVSKGLLGSVSIISVFNPKRYSDEQYASAGSGVFYRLDTETGDALIITNYHVVYSPDTRDADGISKDIRVYAYGANNQNEVISAEYVGGSIYYDIAVLSVKGSDNLKGSLARAVDVADSDKVHVGESAIAIGNPRGDGISATFGVVSVDSEYLDMVASDEMTEISLRVMRIDTAVNSGNSGGGLFNSNGELIGIVSAKIKDDDIENMGYALPSTMVKAVVENILDNCYEKDNKRLLKATLGVMVYISSSSATLDEQSGLVSIKDEITVYSVEANGAADGKLLEGDIVKSVWIGERGIELDRQYQLIDFILNVREGDTLTTVVLRDGELVSVDIEITSDFVAPH